MLKMQNPRTLWLLSAVCLLASNSLAADFSSPALISQTAIPAGGAPVTLATAEFDGSNDYVRRSDTPSVLTDAKTFTFSAWAKIDTDASTQYLWSIGTSGGALRFYVIFSTTGPGMRVRGVNAAGTDILVAQESSGWVPADGWVHLFVTADMTDSGTFQMRIDGVDVTPTPSTFTDDTIDLASGTGARYTIGANVAGTPGNRFDGCMAQMFFDNVHIADHTKFYNGGPVDLGTDGTGTGLAQPKFYFYQAANNFGLNGGSEFDLIVTGSLDECGDTL